MNHENSVLHSKSLTFEILTPSRSLGCWCLIFINLYYIANFELKKRKNKYIYNKGIYNCYNYLKNIYRNI